MFPKILMKENRRLVVKTPLKIFPKIDLSDCSLYFLSILKSKAEKMKFRRLMHLKNADDNF